MSSIGRIVRKNHSALFWCTRHYPKAKREAVYTLYALVKHFDDLSSSSLPEKDKADILAAWQREIANIYDRKVPETDIGRRIYKNCMRFKLPRACMETMLSGFAMDCPKPLFRPSLHEFEEYCRGVSETPSYLILKVIAEFDEETTAELGAAHRARGRDNQYSQKHKRRRHSGRPRLYSRRVFGRGGNRAGAGRQRHPDP